MDHVTNAGHRQQQKNYKQVVTELAQRAQKAPKPEQRAAAAAAVRGVKLERRISRLAARIRRLSFMLGRNPGEVQAAILQRELKLRKVQHEAVALELDALQEGIRQ